MHTKNAMHAENRINCVHCFFACMCCVFRFFDYVASRASGALRVLRNTTWKPYVGLRKVVFQAAIRIETDATHAGYATQIQKTQCTHTKNATDARIASVVCVAFFACVRCIFQFFFDCIAIRNSYCDRLQVLGIIAFTV